MNSNNYELSIEIEYEIQKNIEIKQIEEEVNESTIEEEERGIPPVIN